MKRAANNNPNPAPGVPAPVVQMQPRPAPTRRNAEYLRLLAESWSTLDIRHQGVLAAAQELDELRADCRALARIVQPMAEAKRVRGYDTLISALADEAYLPWADGVDVDAILARHTERTP